MNGKDAFTKIIGTIAIITSIVFFTLFFQKYYSVGQMDYKNMIYGLITFCIASFIYWISTLE